METLIANLTGKARRRHHEGREYVVAPMTLIVPGVLNGTQGPLLYPAEEIAKSVSVWEGVPLTLGHPTKEGSPVSANDPVATRLGHISKPRINNSNLVAEGWFDLQVLQQSNSQILNDLDQGKPVELSTGLFTDNEDSVGTTEKGIPYEAIARNYRPDHLAILSDQVGACSIKDGCGVLVNTGGNLLGFTKSTNGHIHGVNVSRGGDGVAARANDHLHLIDNFRVKQVDGHTHKLDRDSLVDSGVRNKDTKLNTRETDMSKKKLVDGLIGNACCWDEDDREMLEGLTENRLEAMTKDAAKHEQHELVANAAKKGFTDPGGDTHVWNEKTKEWDTKAKDPVKNEETPGVGELEVKPAPKKAPTASEWLAEAPPEVQSVVRNAMASEIREKDHLIEQMTANVADEDKEVVINQLKTEPLEKLRTLMVLAPKPKEEPAQNLYFGSPASVSTRNSDIDQDDILPLPTMEPEKQAV